MCAGAIGWAQVGRVVWGADDPKKGYRRYSEAVFHPKTTVVRGILGGGRRIGERFDKVVATAHHRTVGYNYRTDRHLLFI